MVRIVKYLPRKLLSRLVGIIVHWEGPFFLVIPMIYVFAKWFKISLQDCEKQWTHYPSLGEFFVRRLKSGLRPIADSWAVHPTDSVITQIQNITDGGQQIQAKGMTYRISDLLVSSQWNAKYQKGCSLVYYLCPTDYHRVHSPVDGMVTQVKYVPGDLWPVNDWSVHNIENLFGVNERVIVEISTSKGFLAMIFVGATNVGQIALSIENSIVGNRGQPYVEKTYSNPIQIKKGEELGMFRMGSTIVMVCSEEISRQIQQEKLQEKLINQQVRVGQALI